MQEQVWPAVDRYGSLLLPVKFNIVSLTYRSITNDFPGNNIYFILNFDQLISLSTRSPSTGRQAFSSCLHSWAYPFYLRLYLSSSSYIHIFACPSVHVFSPSHFLLSAFYDCLKEPVQRSFASPFFFFTSVIPQMGHLPSLSISIGGCIGHVQYPILVLCTPNKICPNQ